MGSGRGQQRRTRTRDVRNVSTPFGDTLNSCIVFPGDYARFVAEKGIENTKVVDYYSLPRPGVVTRREHLERWEAAMATQFLHDLIDTETLQVPAYFDISKLVLDVDGVSNIMNASYPSCKEKTIVQIQPDHIWNDYTTMREIVRYDVISGFCIGIDVLVQEERKRRG